MNPEYAKGRRKENKIMNQEKAKGFIAFRSAGSHSPIDVVSIDSAERIIRLIQCKSDTFPDSAKFRLEKKYNFLNKTFLVMFKVI